MWLSEVEAEAWNGLLLVGTLLEREITNRLRAEADLSQVQYEVLARLSEADEGALSMGQLAGQLVTTRSGLTYHVGRLEDRDLVRRTPLPQDNRTVVAELTDDGRDLLHSLAPQHVSHVRRLVFHHLTDAQVAELATIVGILAASLQEGDREGIDPGDG